MFATGKLEIQPDFQREVVWKKDEQARFIDSLVKQLPIPSMCFSLDFKTQKWKVIDGLQRMSTITAFLGSEDWKIGDVEDIQQSLRNTTNNELKNGQLPTPIFSAPFLGRVWISASPLPRTRISESMCPWIALICSA
jgi:uncharacterized protein with ParB-like and HNH nuclease domain